MSAHARGIRISRSSYLLLVVAFAVVTFASLGIAWMARLALHAPMDARSPDSLPMAVPSRSAFPTCLSCGTVLMIRTFQLRDEAPEDAKRRFVYRVTLQMDDGSYRTFSQSAPPQFSVGARVRVLNGAIAART